MVPQVRLERTRPCERQILNLLRLPIPPLGPPSARGGGLKARLAPVKSGCGVPEDGVWLAAC